MSNLKEQLEQHEVEEAACRLRDNVKCPEQRLHLLAKEIRAAMDEIMGDVMPDGAFDAAQFFRMVAEVKDLRRRLAVLEYDRELRMFNESN